MLKRLGYRNVRAWVGHGFDGWPGHAPYDAVVPTAAPRKLSQPLLDQIRCGPDPSSGVGADVPAGS